MYRGKWTNFGIHLGGPVGINVGGSDRKEGWHPGLGLKQDERWLHEL